MESVKNMKVIAVDTSLGTNFLLSACDDATVSDLRDMIQKEHLSCFPEHELINVGALLVNYNQRQYCVTDHLLVGQVFRKCWNKVHAVVSSEFSRAGLFSNDPKVIETKSIMDGKTRIPDGSSSDKRPLIRHHEAYLNAERKESNFNKESSTDEAPSRICHTKAFDNNIKTTPIDLKTFRCPLFSIEAPYTQPLSELKGVTRADATSKGHSDTRSKCKRRRHVEEEIPIEVKKQGKVDCEACCKSDRDKESSPNNGTSSSTKEEPQAKVHEESLESIQPDTDRQDGLNGKVILSKGEEHHVNACEASNDDNIHQHTGGSDNNMESGSGQRKDLLAANTEAFVSSPGKTNLPAKIFESHHNSPNRTTEEAESRRVQKEVLESSSREKGFLYMRKKAEEFISEIKGCPEMPAVNLQEGSKEPNLNDEGRIDQVDLSMGYPIKINDHTVLLVASLSADIVPETQESQMESHDGINPGDEEVAVEPLCECVQPKHFPLVDFVEPKEMEALVPPIHQDARSGSTQELIDQVENLAVLADKEEKSKLKPSVTDQPSRSLGLEETNEVTQAEKSFDKHHDPETQLPDAKCSSDSHNISLRRKLKKYRRRKKVSEIDQIWKQKDGRLMGSNIEEGVQGGVDRLMGSNNEEHGVKGGADDQKLMEEKAELPENLVEANVVELETLIEPNRDESSYKVDINKGTSRTELIERKVPKIGHRRKRKMQSMGSCNERSPFAGEHISEPKKVAIEACFRAEEGGECLEGSSIGGRSTNGQENLCNEDGEGKESNKPHRRKKKRRKETSRLDFDGHNGAGRDNIYSDCEGAPVDVCAKNTSENDFRPSTSKENEELPNALGLAGTEEVNLNRGEMDLKGDKGRERAAKKKSKRKKRVKMGTDLEKCFTREQDQNVNVNDTQSPSKDGIIKSSSPVPPSKEPSEEDMDTSKQGFDVFEFEGSEMADRQKESFTGHEDVSNLEADNLDKLCSAAVNLVENEILSPSKMPTRRTSRKPVHPKRWVTVLSERLASNSTSKSSSKKQRAIKKRGLGAKGVRAVEYMSSDGDIGNEADGAEEGSSQGIVDDEGVACPLGCGRLYSKKTSAFYRHWKKCLG